MTHAGAERSAHVGTSSVDVLVPTYDRPCALAVTLAGLSAQSLPRFRVVVSDQSDGRSAELFPEVATTSRLLCHQGREVEFHRHLPRRGMAEQRVFLLSHVRAEYALFLDDDLLLEPPVLERMLHAIGQEGCGFVGCAPIGLSYAEDHRPHERHFELWEGPVIPERIVPGDGNWRRHSAHNAANLLHIQESFGPFEYAFDYLPHKVAWVGGCVLFDTEALRAVGGFGFWRDLPASHVGEDVLAQLRVMERYGGCGIVPSQVYHLELPTTLPDRRVDAPTVLRPPGRERYGHIPTRTP